MQDDSSIFVASIVFEHNSFETQYRELEDDEEEDEDGTSKQAVVRGRLTTTTSVRTKGPMRIVYAHIYVCTKVFFSAEKKYTRSHTGSFFLPLLTRAGDDVYCLFLLRGNATDRQTDRQTGGRLFV